MSKTLYHIYHKPLHRSSNLYSNFQEKQLYINNMIECAKRDKERQNMRIDKANRRKLSFLEEVNNNEW